MFESESSYYSDDDDDDDDDHVPFFADATLDLEEAQGIAATPDPHVKSLRVLPRFPVLRSQICLIKVQLKPVVALVLSLLVVMLMLMVMFLHRLQ